jgi:hypothetical protein
VAKAKRKAPDKDTLRELFLKSGNVCAFPRCTHLMMNKDGEFIGQICHIEAAEEGGERFNENMTDDERAAVSNLMLMCYEHHVVTNDVDAYPVARLQAMKAEHEAKFTDPARAMVEGFARQINGDVWAKQHASQGGINVAGHGNTIIQGFLDAAPDPFANLDDIMGDFLNDLRDHLHEHPTIRDILIMQGAGTPNSSQPAFLFRDEQYPDISSWVDTLEQRGLVRDHTKGGLRRVRMTHEFVKFLNSTGKIRLTDQAARLLVHAAAGDGTIMLVQSFEGLSVQAGSFALCIPNDEARNQAYWKAGIRELESLDFVHADGSDEVWELSLQGRSAAQDMTPEYRERIKAIGGY